jgi:hypothetical protein
MVASAIRQRALSVPCTCWLTPMPHRIIERLGRGVGARHLAQRLGRDAADRRHGLGAVALHVGGQRLEVVHALADEGLVTRPSVTMTCSSALSSATSVSGLNCSTRQAWRAMSVRARVGQHHPGAARAAFFIQVAATGWFTVGLEPMTRISSACSTSRTGLLTAPEPTPSSSAATLEAWHRRVQWSTLLLPKPVRTSFWNR